MQLRLGDKREERQHELVLGGDRGVREDHRALRVDTGGHIVDHEVEHIVIDMLGRVTVGDHLIVGDDDVRVDAAVLHGHTLFDRTEEVAQMQAAGRAVAGEHGECARVLLEFRERFVRAFLRCEETRAHLIACGGQSRLVCFSHALQRPYAKKKREIVVVSS